jgi:cellulose synthase/poly-beta-1,6-N-acetylglucosamine synthase-like glycosyltransferase
MSKFSVLMPVYWKENPVRFTNALTSVFTNSILPNEVLLVCDGPLTYDLEKVIELYIERSEFRVLRLNENQGIVKALNFALKNVKYDIVVRCDSDDINHINRFEKLINKIQDGFDVVGSQIEEIDDEGIVVACKRVPTDHFDIVRYARKRNPLNHMSVAFMAADVLELGGYPDVYLKEDYALWAKLMGTGRRFANLEESLVSANAGINMYVRRGGLKAALSEIKLQRILVESRVSSPFGAIFNGFVRFFILFSPASFRSFIYIKFLRRSP